MVSQSEYKLSLKFGVRKQMILSHLTHNGKVKMLDMRVRHDINETQKQKGSEACFHTLQRVIFLR